MDRYEAKLSDGRTVVLEADEQPSEADILKAIGEQGEETSAAEAPTKPSAAAKGTEPTAEEKFGVIRPIPWTERAKTALFGPNTPQGPVAPATGGIGQTAAALSTPQAWTEKALPTIDSSAPGMGAALAIAAPNVPPGLTAGAANLVTGGLKFMTTPAGWATAGVGSLPGIARAAVGGLFAGQMIPQGLQETAEGLKTRNLQQVVEGVGTTAMGGAAGLGGVMGVAEMARARKLLPRATAEATKGPDASSQQETGTVHADVSTQPEQGEGEVPVKEGGRGIQPQAQGVAQEAPLPLKQTELLTPEHRSILTEAQKEIDTPVDVVEEPLKEGDPFAGQIATIDRATGRIKLNPKEFSAWLEDMPAERRPGAVRSLLDEERLHLATDDASAGAYWDGLTAVEKAVERRRYTGKWGGTGLSDTMMGHEAVRFRLQQLARMTPREIAEASGASKLGMQAITALENTVRGIRQTLGTKASQGQQAILGRIQSNLRVAKAAATTPGAIRKGSKAEDEIRGKLIDDLTGYVQAIDQAIAQASPEDRASLEKQKAELQAEIAEHNESFGPAGREQSFPGAMRKSADRQEYERLQDRFEELAKAGDMGPEFMAVWQKSEAIKNKYGGHVPPEQEQETPGAMRKGREGEDEDRQARHEDARKMDSGDMGAFVALLKSRSAPAELVSYFSDLQDWHRLREKANAARAEAEKPENKATYEAVLDRIFKSGKEPFGHPESIAARKTLYREADKWRDLQDDFAREHFVQGDDGPKSLGYLTSLYDLHGVAVGLPGSQRWVNELAAEYQRRHPEAPGATNKNKRKKDTSEQNFMDLPPMPKAAAAQTERGGFPTPRATDIDRAVESHFKASQASGAPPSFDQFTAQLQGQFGAVPKEALYYAWTDGLTKHLMNASGKELQDMLAERGLVKDVAKGLKPGESDPTLGGPIPDPIGRAQREFAELGSDIEPTRRLRQMQTKYAKRTDQRRRFAAIGALLDDMSKDAGKAPAKPWSRSTVGPEDIQQQYSVIQPGGAGDSLEETTPEVSTGRQVRAFTLEEASDPAKVAELAIQGAQVDRTGKGAPPATVTRSVIGLKDRLSGKVSLVSVFRDPQTKAVKVTNPIMGERAVDLDAKLIKDWQPTVTMRLREPVQKFRQSFPNQQGFDEWFGTEGIEGTPGIKTSSFAGPTADITREGVETPRGGPGKAEAPTLLPDDPFQSPTARDLTMPRPGSIPGGAAPTPSPRPAPEVGGGMLAGPEIARMEADLARAGAAIPPPPKAWPLGATTPERNPFPTRVAEYGKPAPLGPGWTLRAGIEGTAEGKRTPAAFRKQKQAANDAWESFKLAMDATIKRRAVRALVPRLLDGADGMTALLPTQSAEVIKTAFSDIHPSSQPGKLGQAVHHRSSTSNSTWTIEYHRFFNGSIMVTGPTRAERKASNKVIERRATAATAYVAAGGDFSRISTHQPAKGARPAVPSFREYLDMGQQRAEQWAQSLNPLKRREAGKTLAKIAEMREGLDYAEKHWQDPEFQAGAKAFRKELDDHIVWQNQNGFNVTSRADYIPQRYEGDYWNDNMLTFAGNRLLGTGFTKPRTFTNPYEAIAAGPYRMRTLNLVDLAKHRISQGVRQVERDTWFNGMKSIIDPDSNEPIAVAPKQIKSVDPVTGEETIRYAAPSPNHTLVYPRENVRPLAVRNGFEKLVKSCVSPSRIADFEIGDWAVGQTALRANQMLKHGVILMWDSFHPGRLAQYHASLVGLIRNPKGSFSAIQYRPGELAKAVKKGWISKDAADWATEKVQVSPHVSLTRQELFTMAIRDHGFNVMRLSDALYKNAIESLPGVGPAFHKYLAPYNNWLFQNFIPGLMTEAMLRNAEKRIKTGKEPFSQALGDVVKDTNIFFGNMGRQGIFRNRTFQDAAQILFLAPMWQEGLMQRELRFGTRALGGAARAVGIDHPYRRGLPAMGMLGEGMAKGLATYFVATQMANLITRGHLTFQNEEEGHKLDAWIPIGHGRGIWLSSLSVFAEVTHDILRLTETKPAFFEAIHQMGENRLSPVGKMGLILASKENAKHERFKSTGDYLWGAASQVVPGAGAVPISVATPLREVGHALAPNQVTPNAPGSLARQMAASFTGTKAQVSDTGVTQISRIAQRFLQENKLAKTTGWQQVQTTDPGYSKLRSAIRSDDRAGAEKIYRQMVEGGHKPGEIYKAMGIWARRPFTGSVRKERMFKDSLTPQQQDLYSKAQEERMVTLQKFLEVHARASE